MTTAALDYQALRKEMVERQLRARGVRAELVLDAMNKVEREGYVPSYLGEFAYEDTALPIEDEQTISQPYIVAVMLEALELDGGERVLEVGTGSGYAAAVLAEIAREVYTIERHEALARKAEERLRRDGYENAHVRCGDGTLGWPEAAPFDAIVAAAGGPEIPPSLKHQLKVGGRLVVPVGEKVGLQKLVRVTRTGPDSYDTEDFGAVRFVPLIGAEGWHEPESPVARPARELPLAQSIAGAAVPFDDIDDAPLDGLLERIGSAQVVLLGEASHGSSEFYAMRARITRELILRKGFNIVAVEADWPDAARIDHYVRDLKVSPPDWQAFARFPVWMWRNTDVRDFVHWLHDHNASLSPDRRTRFAGLDLYSLYTSIDSVLKYLDDIDPDVAALARERYGCLTPWQSDPASYGRAAISGEYRSCESHVVRMLEELLSRRMQYARGSSEEFFDAVQNARLVGDAERYYRAIYYGGHVSWNLRDSHMFAVLESLLGFYGPESKAVIWAHNSHVGDASRTEMAARGELNIGELAKKKWNERAYSIGFGTDTGTVAAASHWDGPMEIKQVRPAHERSYEFLCHESELERFMLPLRPVDHDPLRERLLAQRLERAIGVIYRPETELASHYFHAVLPRQFDEYIWFDRTEAVTPLPTREVEGMPDTYPFGL